MNAQAHSAPVAASASAHVAELNEALRRLRGQSSVMAISVPIGRLEAMPIEDLAKLLGALAVLDNVALAMGCQPKLWDRAERNPSPSGELVGEITDFIEGLMDVCARELARALPRTADEADARARALMIRNCEMLESFIDIAEAAAGHAAEIAALKRAS